MAAIDDVQTSINNVASLLAQITANPQPTYSVQGVSISWTEYKSSLTKDLNELTELLVILSGPYQLTTVAVP